MKVVRNQLGLLFFGSIVLLPFAVTVFVLVVIGGNVDIWGRTLLTRFFPEESIHPGMGLVLGVALVYLTGVLFKKTSIGNLLSRVPMVGFFFVRRKGGAMSLDRLVSLTPCLFLYSPSCPSYGWILSQEKVRASGNEAPFSLVNVYYPNVPTLVTGEIFPVRKESVVKLGNSSREIIDLLLYSLRSPESIKLLPWDYETAQQFQERVQRFGLPVGG